MADSNFTDDESGNRGPLVNGTEFSHYRIIRKLDEGGMGEIYLAEDLKLHREVAIKVLRPEFVGNQDRLERFLREARTAARISHANVMSIYDMGSVTDPQTGRETAYIVLEYISGDTLADMLDSRQLGIKEGLRIAEKTASGLAAAHKLNIVHRDIKADNIKFDENGEPKILDFGLAKAVDPYVPASPDEFNKRRTDSRELTQEGKILGTVSYMSPEQARGDIIDTRSDIFSFGIVLYRLFTGRFPFDAPDRVSTLAKIIESRQQTPSNINNQIPAELDRVIEKCLRKDPDERYQDTRDLVVDLRSLRRQFDSGISDSDSFITSGPGHRKKKTIRMSSAGALIILAAMIVISVLAISYLPSGSGDDNSLQASENRLAIMYFSNLADPDDPQRLGEIVANILITDLSVSQDVKVVSSQRLRDVLQLMGEDTPKNIDEELASQVARKAKTRWMLTGSILQTEPTYVITAQLIETSSGHVISSHRITGEENQTIFAVVDQLTSKVRDDLSIPSTGDREAAGIFASAANATKSKEAFRYYLEGVDYQRQLLHFPAREAFRKATELDSTFALAWYGLSFYLAEDEGRDVAVENAVKYMDILSPLEQLYILAREQQHKGQGDSAEVIYKSIIGEYPEEKWAYYQLGVVYYGSGQTEKAIELHLKAIQIDPLFKDVYNQLAYEYDRAGNFEKSLWAINKYIDLVPSEPNPYDTRGELYALNGQLDKARESFERALSLNPEFYISALNLGHIYIIDQDYKKAESLFQSYVDHPEKDIRSEVRLYLARIYEHQGQIERAIRVIHLATESDRLEYGAKSTRVAGHFNKLAALYSYVGDYATAIAHIDSAIAVFDLDSGLVDGYDAWGERWSATFKAYMLALSGKHQYAAKLMDTALKSIDTTELDDMLSYHYVIGRFHFGMGQYQKAVSSLLSASEFESSFIIRYLLGRSYFELGNTGQAVAYLEKAMSTYNQNRGYWMTEGVFIHYWLGRAYEASGWNDRAVEQYQALLDILKAADSDLILVEDARGRLTRLTHGS